MRTSRSSTPTATPRHARDIPTGVSLHGHRGQRPRWLGPRDHRAGHRRRRTGHSRPGHRDQPPRHRRHSITKTLIGPVDGASTTFSAFLDCDGTAYDQRVTVTATEADPGTALIDGIPVGVHCTFTEIDIPGTWSLGGVASPDVTIDSPTPVQVNAVNTRRTGDLTVVKRIAGPPEDKDLSFLLRLDCSDNVFDTLVPIDLRAGTTQVREAFSGIPTGVTCRAPKGPSPAGWELADITPDHVVVDRLAVHRHGDQPTRAQSHRTSARTPRGTASHRAHRSTTAFHIRGLLGGHGATATARLYGPFAPAPPPPAETPALPRTVTWHVGTAPTARPRSGSRDPGVYTGRSPRTPIRRNRSATHHCGQPAETTVVAKPAFIAPIVNGGFSGTLPLRQSTRVPDHPDRDARHRPARPRAHRARQRRADDSARRRQDVGWLRKSAGVADKIGTTVIAGHVSDRHDNPGAMFHLSRAHAGQHITIRHAGKSYRFTVVDTATFDRDHRLPHRYFTTTGRHRLVLISCTHRVTYPNGHFHYTRYQVVVAD